MFFKELPNFESIRLFGARYPQFDFSAIEAFITLARLSESVGQAMDEHFSRHELSRGRFFILMLLMRSEGEGCAPAYLAESCGCTRATVTGLLDTLEGAKLIVREASPDDRRALVVRLTDLGRKKMDNLLPDHYGRISRLMQHLSPDERATFVGLMSKIALGLPALQNP